MDTIDNVTSTTDPAYFAVLDQVAPGTNAAVEASKAPGESWVDTLQKVVPIIAQGYQQKQLLDIQVSRARAGLPPLDPSSYAPGVNVGLNPDTRNLVLILGGLAVGLFALKAIARR